MFRFGQVDPSQFNDQLKDMYNWSNVAERTEKVYASIYQSRNSPLIERLRRYYGCGLYAGKVFCMIMALDYLIWKFLEWLSPTESIEIAEVFPYQKYRKYFQDCNTTATTAATVTSTKTGTGYNISNTIIVEEDEDDDSG